MDDRGKEPWDSAKPAVAALFQTPTVSTADRALLHEAHLKGSGNTMRIMALKEHADALTPTDLQTRDHRGDLLSLVRHIEDEL
jgi:hypothetical protein